MTREELENHYTKHKSSTLLSKTQEETLFEIKTGRDYGGRDNSYYIVITTQEMKFFNRRKLLKSGAYKLMENWQNAKLEALSINSKNKIQETIPERKDELLWQ
jgi:hypothetical protein